MNQEKPANEATATVASARNTLASASTRIMHAIDHELSPGDVAQLRRLTPDDPGTPAFWKVMATYLEPTGLLPLGSEARDEVERQWAAILAGMALTQGLHQQGRRPGQALATAGYSELRFTRLLRARGAALLDEVRGAARYLSSKGEPHDWFHFVALIRYQDGDRGEHLRREIARDYYGSIHQ